MDKGRPSIYSDELADEICLRISTSNKGLHSICKGDDMPAYSTVFHWLNDKSKNFLDKYEKAKEHQADFLADEILEIADDSSNDIITNDEGKKVQNAEYVQRSRLRVDARKWIASKLKPKKFGENSKVDLNVTKEVPIFSDPQNNGD